jgi:hypothetical protein
MNIAFLNQMPVTHRSGHCSAMQRDAVAFGIAGSKS